MSFVNNQSGKRKHKTLSIQEKVQLLKMVEGGTPVKRLCKIFCVGTSTVYDIKKKKDEILEYFSDMQSKKCSPVRKTMRDSKSRDLERSLVKWFELRKRESVTVTGGMLVEQARMLHKELKLNFECKYSHGWLDKFKSRHGIRLYNVRSKRSEADSEIDSELSRIEECTSLRPNEELSDSESFIKRLLQFIADEELHPEQVYSGNQNAIFWHDMPQELYPSEDSENSDYQHIGEKVAFFNCFNAAGTHRCKLLLVGKSSSDKSLKLVKVLPAIYKVNEQSCITPDVLIDWLVDHFTVEVKAHYISSSLPEDSKILLILDSILAPSDEELLVIDNIHIFFFPFHSSASVLPQDQGISLHLRRWYRLEFLTYFLDAVSRGKSIEEFKTQLNIKDCLWIFARAWENISECLLRQSWCKMWHGMICDDTPDKDGEEVYAQYKRQIIDHVVDHIKSTKKNLTKYVCYEGIEEWVESDGEDSFLFPDAEKDSLGSESQDYKTDIVIKLEEDSNEGNDECCVANSTQSIKECIQLTTQLISGLEKQNIISEQDIMYLYRLKTNLVSENFKLKKCEGKSKRLQTEKEHVQ